MSVIFFWIIAFLVTTTAAPTTAAPTTVAPTTVAPTTVAPTTVAPTTAAPTITQGPTGTGTGGGEGGSGGGNGGIGEEMSCSCKLPLLGNSSLAESGRTLNNVVSRVMERKKRSTERDLPIESRGGGHHQPSNSYNDGYQFGSLLQIVVLASLAALAAYGNVIVSMKKLVKVQCS